MRKGGGPPVRVEDDPEKVESDFRKCEP